MGKAYSDGRYPYARSSGARSRGSHRGHVPPRSAVVDGDELAAATGIRESTIHARRHRRLGADGGSESPAVLMSGVRAPGAKANGWFVTSSAPITPCP